MWRKQAKIERRLGEHWQRPKGMHHATHRKLLAAMLACEELRDRALRQFAQRLGLLSEPGP
jgi:hypothetical protein